METTEKPAADLTSKNAALQLVRDMESSISQCQSALLGHHLAEFERCTARQQEFFQELEPLVFTLKCLGKHHEAMIDPELILAAKNALGQGRCFAAVLRRIWRNLEILHTALQGPSNLYTQPGTPKVELTSLCRICWRPCR
jgi:hypothetical protein